jgi:hypothetical protein
VREHHPVRDFGMGRPAVGWPFIGRETELAAIADAFDSPKAGCSVLAGGPGVGKTRLAREALRRAEALGFVTLWVVATRASAVPGLPLPSA